VLGLTSPFFTCPLRRRDLDMLLQTVPEVRLDDFDSQVNQHDFPESCFEMLRHPGVRKVRFVGPDWGFRKRLQKVVCPLRKRNLLALSE
jgi:hypothetical protein